MSRPVPFYRFPDNDEGHNLKLVSILTNPNAATFEQGDVIGHAANGKSAFARPVATTTGFSGEICVLDNGRGRVQWLKYDREGFLLQTETLPRSERVFPSVIDLTMTPDGNVWITDSRLRHVFVFDAEGRIVDSISAPFVRPVGIVYHPQLDQVIVTDLAQNSMFCLGTDGTLRATYNSDSGVEIEAPSFVAIGPRGHIYVVEALSALIKVFDQDWVFLREFGGSGDGPGFFTRPKGIAVDDDGRIYVVDALFDNVQVFNSEGDLLLTLGTSGADAGQFWQPMGVSVDNRQRILISDSYNRRVQVFVWE